MMVMPLLRFKRNDGTDYPDWKEDCIKSFGKCIAGATPSTKKPLYWDNGTIPWLSSGEVNKGQIFDTDKKITQLGYENSSTKMVKPNSVIIAMAGQGKTRGTVGITRIPLCTNQSLCSIETDETVIGDYLYQHLKTRYVDLRNLSSGDDARGGLNLEIIRNFKVQYPSDLEEQQKIADFLSDVDNQIEHYQQSLNNLESQKKEMLRQVFSQELRFKRDDGSDYPDWEEDSLKNCCDIIGGGTPSTNKQEYWNGNIQWFTPTEIKQKYVSNSDRTITELGLQKSSAKLLPAGTVLLTTRATLGKMSIATKECTTNQGFHSLIPNNRCINEFLYYLQPIVERYCLTHHSGTTFKETSKTMLEKCIIPLPCPEEQQKIADFFSDFDERIELERQRLQTMQDLKKGLLQQMFC